MAWGPNAPTAVQTIPASERHRRVKLTADVCIIDHRKYFVRACLDLRIDPERESFRWLVWVKVTAASFREIRSIWRQLRARPLKPTDGHLASELPYDASTLGLPIELRDGGPGYRPQAFARSGEHILGREQRAGIRVERAYELAGRAMHASTPPAA
jgi:hypothetical protein